MCFTEWPIMVLLSSEHTYTSIVFLGTFTLAYIVMKRKQMKSIELNYPPGLPSLPIIGSLPFLAKLEDLHVFLTLKSRTLGNVFSFYLAKRYEIILLQCNTCVYIYSFRPSTTSSGESGRPRADAPSADVITGVSGWRTLEVSIVWERGGCGYSLLTTKGVCFQLFVSSYSISMLHERLYPLFRDLLFN